MAIQIALSRNSKLESVCLGGGTDTIKERGGFSIIIIIYFLQGNLQYISQRKLFYK